MDLKPKCNGASQKKEIPRCYDRGKNRLDNVGTATAGYSHGQTRVFVGKDRSVRRYEMKIVEEKISKEEIFAIYGRIREVVRETIDSCPDPGGTASRWIANATCKEFDPEDTASLLVKRSSLLMFEKIARELLRKKTQEDAQQDLDDFRPNVKEVIIKDFATADRISASMIGDVAAKKLDPKGKLPPDGRDALVQMLKEVAARVLKEMFEPDQGSAEAAFQHADALRFYAESRGLLKKGT